MSARRPLALVTVLVYGLLVLYGWYVVVTTAMGPTTTAVPALVFFSVIASFGLGAAVWGLRRQAWAVVGFSCLLVLLAPVGALAWASLAVSAAGLVLLGTELWERFRGGQG